jgi:hypothetical protein
LYSRKNIPRKKTAQPAGRNANRERQSV